MLPPGRLTELLNQALELQVLRCTHHNTSQGVILNNSTLLKDHCCPKTSFPAYTVQVSTFTATDVGYFSLIYGGNFSN